MNHKLGENPSILTPKERSAEGLRDVIWYMMYMAASQKEEFKNGMFRIDDQNQELFNFINTCTSSPGSYGRISTHFGAYAEHTAKLEGKKQRGLDMGDLKLPGGKHSILFSTLPDNTTFVKLEEYGLPPIWQKEFMTFESLVQVSGHSRNLVKHVTGFKKEGDYTSRRENPTPQTIEIFHKCLSNLKEMYQKLNSTTGLIDIGVLDARLEVEKSRGDELGLSEMHRNLQTKIQGIYRSKFKNWQQELPLV